MALQFNEWGYLEPADEPIEVHIAEVYNHFGRQTAKRQ
jgi:hypothetical protein